MIRGLTGKELRLAMLEAMLAEWRRPIRSDADEGRITEYFVGIGWGWALREAGVEQYSEAARRAHPGLLNWCGIAIGWAGLQVGYHLAGDRCLPVRLDPAIAHHVLPSTYRADKRPDDPEHWDQAGHEPPERPDELRKADIICVETSRGRDYGDHFAMVVEAITPPGTDGDITTVEANAWGRRGDDSGGRGIVRRTRQLEDIRRVLRLEADHFEVVEATL